MKRKLANITKSYFFGEPKVLPVVSKAATPHVYEDSPQQTVIVVDSSGSMTENDFPPDRLEAAKSSAIDFANERAKRSPRDEIAVVSYETIACLECPLRSVKHLNKITRKIKGISFGGLTAMGNGLHEAEKVLLGRGSHGLLSRALYWLSEEPPLPQHSGFMRRVVLLTDGHQSPGYGCKPLPVANRLKRAGVQIDCIGVGGHPSAVDETLLRKISSISEATGKPRYRFIKDREALQKHF